MDKKNNNIVIEAENLHFAYANKDSVIENVGFSVKSGSITALIGPNGAGKTTLLKLLLGFIVPQKGSVRILGKRPSQARKYVGYVPQRFDFDKTFPITVWEFLKFSHPDVSQQKIEEYLGHLGMEKMRDELLGSLSGGQLQRVLITRAMLDDPEVLYLDEPSAGIDMAGEQTFYDLVSHLHRKHENTIVMVSHEIDSVTSFADNVICVNRSLVCYGEPKEVLTPEVMAELFGKGALIHHHH